jgi:para-aminobenzoate synthetase component 1
MQFIQKLNKLGKKRVPFLFVISYDKSKVFAQKLEKLNSNVLFSFNTQTTPKQHPKVSIKKTPICFKKYNQKFTQVIQEITKGNTYFLNLTQPTKIKSNLSLMEIYDNSHAKFKLFFKDKFVVFSPERFIKIKNNTIFTYPMKGTIDASLKNAKKIILNNKKELAEHVMVVDLLRNDLSMVAKKVKVDRFRYVKKIKAGKKELFQISSKISGKLDKNWQNNVGDILNILLPAGSITGAPKKKTVEILKKIEGYDRGFFSGIFGYFDGKKLDSAVMIRFIEKNNNKLIFKSGGGITIDSNNYNEYQEMIEKIYIPT